MEVKIALIQQNASHDVQSNINKGVEAVKAAAESGAKIIYFAELAFTRFYPQEKSKDDHLTLAEPIPGPITNAFSNAAKERGVVIILNLYELDGDKAYDSSPVINSDGNLLGTTRMIHITDYSCFHEKEYYEP